MQLSNLFYSLLASGALTIVACDGVDDAQERDLVVADADNADDADADEREEQVVKAVPSVQDGAGAEELELKAAEQVSEGPPGTCCAADCGGDGSHAYYLLGTADDCNHRAAEFCSWYGWSLIDAEWLPC